MLLPHVPREHDPPQSWSIVVTLFPGGDRRLFAKVKAIIAQFVIENDITVTTIDTNTKLYKMPNIDREGVLQNAIIKTVRDVVWDDGDVKEGYK